MSSELNASTMLTTRADWISLLRTAARAMCEAQEIEKRHRLARGLVACKGFERDDQRVVACALNDRRGAGRKRRAD